MESVVGEQSRGEDTKHQLIAGRYELREFVGKGSMGAVYRAHDRQLDRSVALKCVRLANDSHLPQLAAREARILASLNHPNIMQIYDVCTIHDQVWLVTEWVQGVVVNELAMPLHPLMAAAIMAQICSGLAAAHQAGIYHRDIKPSNIMIRDDGRVLLLDFGVAFASGTSSGETVAGSPRYSAPEILEGEAPSAATDLFSAALLLLELMTGKHPFPDLAPLPLYRQVKDNLTGIVEEHCDGLYPPLVEMIRCLLLGEACDGVERGAALTRSVAIRFEEVLHVHARISPERFLASYFNDPEILDAFKTSITDEVEAHLANADLSPRRKAYWFAYQHQIEVVTSDHAISAESVQRRVRRLLPPRKPRVAQESQNDRRRTQIFSNQFAIGLLIFTMGLIPAVLYRDLLIGKFRSLRVVFDEEDQPQAASSAVVTANSTSAGGEALSVKEAVREAVKEAVQEAIKEKDESPKAIARVEREAEKAVQKAMRVNDPKRQVVSRQLEPPPSVTDSPKVSSEIRIQPGAVLASPGAAGTKVAALTDTGDSEAAIEQALAEVHLIANAWAEVSVDGVAIGRLPSAKPFSIPAGVRRVRLESPVVEPMEAEIQIAAGQENRFRFTLKPKTSVRMLRLKAEGQLFVDGIDAGLVREKSVTLSYGEHEVWVKRGTQIMFSKKIQIGPNTPDVLELE